MKVGLLTVPFNNNYGGLLQAFALKSVLSEMGHEVIIIDRRRNRHKSAKFLIYYLLVKLHIIKDFLEARVARLSTNTDLFKSKYLQPFTEPYFTSRELSGCLDIGCDVFVVGSDQVWRYLYAKDSISDYFFSFLKGTRIPRFSYAASFGTDVMDYPEKNRLEVVRLLKDFDGISVREESGKILLSKYFDVKLEDVHVVLDPTLLLSVDRYVRLFQEDMNSHGDYLFTYVLDESLVDAVWVEEMAHKMGLGRKDMKAQTGNLDKLSVIEPVEDWLSSIHSARFVITDSFHGTVFSIIFNRPFLTVANPRRGTTRLKGLLSQFGLEDRLVDTLDSSSDLLFQRNINWPLVNNRLQLYREDSLRYLRDSLESALQKVEEL